MFCDLVAPNPVPKVQVETVSKTLPVVDYVSTQGECNEMKSMQHPNMEA